MSSTTQAALASLIQTLVPRARNDERLRNDLQEMCHDILSSHLGNTREADLGHLSELIRRQLVQSSSDPTSITRFSNLLTRLMDQPVLARKQASVQFLQALGPAPRASSSVPTFLPSLRAPPQPPRSLSPRLSAPEPAESTGSAKRKSQAGILRDYRARIARPHLPEHLLLRDTIFLLQGISGKYVRFADSRGLNEDDDNKLVFVDDSKHVIPPPTRTLILRISELGHLYSRVSAFVREREGKAGVGMIEQSLCHYLQTQLTEYYRLVAVLESQASASDAAAEETGLTLRRLEVWIDSWRLKMRMMSACVEGCIDTHGGALVSLINGYTDNGDPFVRSFTNELLEEVSKPFFAMLQKWLFAGELYDPYGEFFVVMDPELASVGYAAEANALSADGGFAGGGEGIGAEDGNRDDQESGLRLWQAKYQFSRDMLPSFVEEVFGKKIFSTGRSLNFIRYTCHDSDWVATRNKMNNADKNLQYSDIASLERSIDTAYKIANQRIFDVFVDKFKLMDHLKALKMYLMLCQGDFVEQLMDALAPNLSRPANTLYRHNLTATLEAAVRSSNAAADPPDVLRRLDARMLEYTHGEIGWDVFTLEYKIETPIDTVVDPDAMRTYLKVFHHLWRLKRVERSLGETWTRAVGGARSFLRVPELEADWRAVRLAVSEMVHFVRQMLTYCHLEVIECSWMELVTFVNRKEGDLDALIAAHRKYLDRVLRKILLLSPKAGKEEHILNQVLEVFQLILQFREATDNFYNHTMTEATRLDMEKDAARGVHTGIAVPSQSNEALARSMRRINEYATSFSERAQSIAQSLQSHPDLDCRSLGLKLNFSDFYKAKREHRA